MRRSTSLFLKQFLSYETREQTRLTYKIHLTDFCRSNFCIVQWFVKITLALMTIPFALSVFFTSFRSHIILTPHKSQVIS